MINKKLSVLMLSMAIILLMLCGVSAAKKFGDAVSASQSSEVFEQDDLSPENNKSELKIISILDDITPIGFYHSDSQKHTLGLTFAFVLITICSMCYFVFEKEAAFCLTERK